MTKTRFIALACALVASAGISAAQASATATVSGAATQTTSADSTTTTTTGQSTPSPATGTPSTPPSTPPATTPKPAARTRLTGLPSGAIADGTAQLVVRLSAAPAPNSPAPLLSPSLAGTWKSVGDSETFTPKSTLEPCSTYTLTVWAGTDALGHPPLGTAHRQTLRVACPSLRGLQQALARLRYLPYTIDAAHGRNSGARAESRGSAAHYAFDPPAARLAANESDAPGLAYGSLDPTTRGALMVYQAAHGLSATGVPDGSTWASLLAAETLGHVDPTPYTFVTVSESSPETLEVHRGGRVVISTPANTGVAGAETERGTFPIYARYVSTTMTGTNPDGSHYSDPGVPWVNYFNGGDAVHGFPRASYGFPQSNGCVELPIGTAGQVYPLLAIGDLVVVS
ncbi:MAG TPA: L,D-transpeptidase family protein [Solirubrobacteraceae bacterium]|nr:L,D-transpeptidase family protein [Solirubrobacteraceae bacterium]